MSAYLDTSVLVSLLANDVFSARADTFFRRRPSVLFVSDFCCTEFSAVVGKQVRTKSLTSRRAQALFADLDNFRRRIGIEIETLADDVRTAESFLRRLDLSLRAPDAIHIAIAQRANAELATFDDGMADSARALGISVVAL